MIQYISLSTESKNTQHLNLIFSFHEDHVTVKSCSAQCGSGVKNVVCVQMEALKPRTGLSADWRGMLKGAHSSKNDITVI